MAFNTHVVTGGGFLHIFKYVILLYIMHYCLLHMIHMHANLNIYVYIYIRIHTAGISWVYNQRISLKPGKV